MTGLGRYNARATEIYDSLNDEERAQLRYMLEFGFTVEAATALFLEGLGDENQSGSVLAPRTSVRITPLAQIDVECFGQETTRDQLEESLRRLRPPFQGKQYVPLAQGRGWLFCDGPFRMVFRWDESTHTAVVFAIAPAGIDPTAPVWRYFKQGKAVDLCSTGELYFSRLDQLDDPLEGRLPAASTSMRVTAFESVFGDSAENVAALSEEVFRASTYVTCWTLQSHESWFGWKNYCSDETGRPDGGVAVMTTWRRLQHLGARLRRQDDRVFLRFVGYLDPARDSLPNAAEGEQAFFKAMWFSAEREIRFAFLRHDSGELNSLLHCAKTELPPGERIPCDLNRLVVRIVLNPWASPEQKQELRSVIAAKHPMLTSRVFESAIRSAQR